VLGPDEVKSRAPVLTIKEGEFRWTKKAHVASLEDINLSLQKCELVGILGRVGAGKTSLLSAIAGDMNRDEGEVIVNGTVAYAPQNPWIMSTTVRDNILFSHSYDETFYNLVLDACALRQDLSLLPQGDMTEVVEKGITVCFVPILFRSVPANWDLAQRWSKGASFFSSCCLCEGRSVRWYRFPQLKFVDRP